MANSGMPKSDGVGYQDMRYGRPEFQAERLGTISHGKRITSDDKRAGFTCLSCLDAQHSKCYVWEGQRACPCNICAGSHNRKDMIARRSARQTERSKPRPRSRPRAASSTGQRRGGPQPLSETEKDQIVKMVGTLVAACAEHHYTEE